MLIRNAKIHNGADDNASGVAGVLELAHHLSSNSNVEHYNYLFICFSAEESGLLGSKYFTNNPTLQLS
jgi:Zn-dependent M28 family amino/carboxypeptidase